MPFATCHLRRSLAALGTDALREPGARLMEILVNRTDQKCVNGGCAYAGEDY
jgi:hypothetical protein